MDDLDYRNDFIKIIRSNQYFIDNLGIEDYPIRSIDFKLPDEQLEHLRSLTYKILLDASFPQNELKYFSNIILDLSKIFHVFTINNNEYFLQNDISVIVEDYDVVNQSGLNTKVDLSNIKSEHLRILEIYSKNKFNACEKLYKEIGRKNQMEPQSLNSKISFKISVAEIALLFRLLVEEGTISKDNSEEIYRFISLNFSSKKTENISASSVKNKFLSPDSTSLKNLDILLINLRLQLKKIQK